MLSERHVLEIVALGEQRPRRVSGQAMDRERWLCSGDLRVFQHVADLANRGAPSWHVNQARNLCAPSLVGQGDAVRARRLNLLPAGEVVLADLAAAQIERNMHLGGVPVWAGALTWVWNARLGKLELRS